MANALYGLGRQKFGNGEIDWIDDDIKVALVDTDDYSVSIDADEFLDDLGTAAIVATSGNLSSKANALGVLDAADVNFSSVSGDQCEALVIYKDTGNAATSPLIAYIDTATGLPITPTGADIQVVWDDGANKILKL